MTESEPNDERGTANGPLLSGDTWSGIAGTSNDKDVYVLYVAPGQTEVHITLKNTGGGDASNSCILLGGYLGWRFGDNEGNVLVSQEEYEGIAPGNSGSLNYTVTGPATYYYAVDADSCGLDTGPGSAYNFTVTSTPVLLGAPYEPPSSPPPAAAPAPAPAPARPVTCHVPALTGLTLAVARVRLTDAHCELGTVRRRGHRRRGAQRVRTQSIPAGSTRRNGTPASVTLR
jgi:hypothetical protein